MAHVELIKLEEPSGRSLSAREGCGAVRRRHRILGEWAGAQDAEGAHEATHLIDHAEELGQPPPVELACRVVAPEGGRAAADAWVVSIADEARRWQIKLVAHEPHEDGGVTLARCQLAELQL